MRKFVILFLCAIANAGCSTTPTVVYKDRIVEVPGPPVPANINPELIKDCPPSTEVPASGPLPLSAVLDRLSAVENALALCRFHAEQLRNTK
jgi:hypothetical protein